jgi:hypothetical protein
MKGVKDNMSMLNLYTKPGYRMSLWKRIKWWFRRARYARQRAHWGFSEYDIWDFKTYHAELVAAMMRYWAGRSNSHHPEMADEEWQAVMNKIAECFEFWNKDLPTPSYDAYRATVRRVKNEDGSITTECPDGLSEAWRKEEMDNYKMKRQKLKEGFDLLFEYYPHLWD